MHLSKSFVAVSRALDKREYLVIHVIGLVFDISALI